jgi:hypothetical protein
MDAVASGGLGSSGPEVWRWLAGCVIGTFSLHSYLSVGQGEERRGPGEEEATTQIAVRLGAAAASLDVRHCKGKGTGLLSEVAVRVQG